MNENWNKKISFERIYLPSSEDVKDNSLGQPFDVEIQKYRERHFPYPPENNNECLCYSIPISYVPHGQPQGAEAERISHERISALKLPITDTAKGSLWQVCFQGIAYAGRSYMKERNGQLLPREHDLVVFNKFNGEHFISLIEIKSSCDSLAGKAQDNVSKLSKSNESTIKSNKRTGQNQIKDHLEIIMHATDVPEDKINTYLFWPFLTMYTKNPRGEEMMRWKEEKGKHVFTDTLSDQQDFNHWFRENVLCGKRIEEEDFYKLFGRYIVLSCGIFVNEIHDGMLALLTPEQGHVLHNIQPKSDGFPTIIHGGAGTGKTLLVLHRLESLHRHGLLNNENMALYMCMFGELGYDFSKKLEKKNIDKHVDVIVQKDSSNINYSLYRHVFMDECDLSIFCSTTPYTILDKRLIKYDEDFYNNHLELYDEQEKERIFGDYWYFINIEQIKLTNVSPKEYKTPDITLSKVVRNPKTIYDYINALCNFCNNGDPARTLPPVENFESTLAHNINGPSIFWINSDTFTQQICNDNKHNCLVFNALVKCLVDLNSTKGIKASDICVLLTLDNADFQNKFSPENINKAVESLFVPNSSYTPIIASSSFKIFIEESNSNKFLLSKPFQVLGLEFKVLVIAVDAFEDFDDQYLFIYMMASRCTCFLIFVCGEIEKKKVDFLKQIKKYKFDTKNIDD